MSFSLHMCKLEIRDKKKQKVAFFIEHSFENQHQFNMNLHFLTVYDLLFLTVSPIPQINQKTETESKLN